MEEIKLRRKDLIYPELCYRIIGVLFKIRIEIGSGHKESFYQKAIAHQLEEIKPPLL